MRWYLHIKCHWSYPGGYIKSTQTQQNTSKREPWTELMEWTVCSAQKMRTPRRKTSRTVEAPKFVVRVAIALNTLRPRQNGRHFPDDIFKYIFLNENVWISIEISLNYVHKSPIKNKPALVQIMAWRRLGDKPLSKPIMVRLLTHICVTRPQWVKFNPRLGSKAVEALITFRSDVSIWNNHLAASRFCEILW